MATSEERRSRVLSDLKERAPSRRGEPITDSQRASAARIQIAYDRKRGVKSERWITELAKRA